MLLTLLWEGGGGGGGGEGGRGGADTPFYIPPASLEGQQSQSDIESIPLEEAGINASLEEAGIDASFHPTLLSAGLDLQTLRMAADDRSYLASELEKSGITKPGDRIKILNALHISHPKERLEHHEDFRYIKTQRLQLVK